MQPWHTAYHSTDWNYQGHHTRIEGLSAEDQYEKCVALTHWLSGMLQPQHPTGPYLSGADCTAWYVSVIFVRKKRHCRESMMSQKQARYLNPLPYNFCMCMSKCSFLLTLSLWRSPRHQPEFALHEDIMVQVTRSTGLRSPIWKYEEQIVIILSRRQISRSSCCPTSICCCG